MKVRVGLKRLLKDERGFSLPELLVTMLMMLTVMFALHSIFDMSLRVFSFGNDKVEVVENARIGMERMEREIRASYPDDSELLDIWAEDEISSYNSGLGEQIIYALDSSDSTLRRNNRDAVEYVDDLTFTYFNENMVEIDPDFGSESSVSIVRIKLEVKKQGQQDAEQILTTDVHLRNRVGGDA